MNVKLKSNNYKTLVITLILLNLLNYILHIMPVWIPAILLLPFLISSVDTIIEENKIYPFVVLYLLILLSNSYLSILIGILSSLYFSYRLSKHRGSSSKYYIHKIILGFASLLLSLGVSCVYLVTNKPIFIFTGVLKGLNINYTIPHIEVYILVSLLSVIITCFYTIRTEKE